MNRTDENRTLAVVRTRLPYTDRRSLSQAWFSALHLSENATSHIEARTRRVAPPGAAERREPPAAGARAATGAARGGVRTEPRARAGGALAPAGSSEPSRARTGEASGGANAYATVARRARLRTTLTFDVAGERVALLLRRDGATLHVVALCRPAVESAVRRALALAGAQVRSQGDELRAGVRTCAASRP